MSVLIKSAPAPLGRVPQPNRGDRLAYGKYLVTIADCMECHTQEVKGQLVAGKEFAGGRLFETLSGASVYTANITPENDTGIGVWTEERVIKKVALTCLTPKANRPRSVRRASPSCPG